MILAPLHGKEIERQQRMKGVFYLLVAAFQE